jgi:cytochrome c peroxidase
MTKKPIYISIILIFSSLAFTLVTDIYFTIPKDWPSPIYDFAQNPLTKEKIQLGRALFNDPILSKDNTISCSSCHLSHTAFTHIDHQLSHGIQNRIGTRNASSLLNLAWNKSFMWDGAINNLDMQSLAPISHHDEMDETLENVVLKLQKSKHYPKAFQRAFQDSTVTGEHLLKSISQFMLTLVSSESKYDKVTRKEFGASFTESEAKGYQLFKKNCSTCHTEPLFTNYSFQNNGLEPDTTLNDIGRARITKNPQDSLKFKVPTLRNIEMTYPYMHDGRFKSLQMVLFHYTENIHNSPTLANQLKTKIILSELDKNNLVDFLKTLTDDDFLHNPNFQYLNVKSIK